jgi:radical SAM superfamily enzyme YgiQ (UPF0313 family)
MQVALVNTNRIMPPIAPIGLEYVAEALNSAGHDLHILDLCWEEDLNKAAINFFKDKSIDVVGLSLRNTDDCAFTTQQSFLDDFTGIVNTIRKNTDAVIALGGVGFSIMPEEILKRTKADIGIWGDGEFPFTDLLNRMQNKDEWHHVPNSILYMDNRWIRHQTKFYSLKDLPAMRRNWFDNTRYFYEGGQAGIETKRGCPCQCIYCADPVAKGRKVRCRIPAAVAFELESLVKQGIDHIHTCDSEFNLPEEHALEVCREIIKHNLGDKLCWYAYCSPAPFSMELAFLMKKAGCRGINFGVDSGDKSMLKRLKRSFEPEDILSAARFCREAGIVVMFDLLVGAPGESEESIARTITLMKEANPECVGISLGVRVYPETELSGIVEKLNREKIKDLTEPSFFLEPDIAPIATKLIGDLTYDDERFLFFNPEDKNKNYNYNANQILVDAIRNGYRGAYWDILRRLQD